MSDYDVDRGNRTPFPSAFGFVEEQFGMRKRDKVSAFTREDRDWSIRLLRTAYKLRQYVNSKMDSYLLTFVRCPKCGKKEIETRTGMLEPLGDTEPRVVAIHVACDCKKFRTSDYSAIEALALTEWA
jgi:hypothetical protein